MDYGLTWGWNLAEARDTPPSAKESREPVEKHAVQMKPWSAEKG